MSSETSDLKLEIPRISLDPCLPYTGRRLDNELSFASVDWDGPRQPLTQMKVLPEGPLVGPRGVVTRRFNHERTKTPIRYLYTHLSTFTTPKIQ